MPLQITIGIDKDLADKYFFNEEDGQFITELSISTIEELVVLAGWFPSKSQARKNNWTGPLKSGVHQIKTKKDFIWYWLHPDKEKNEHSNS